jgi:hypothetical protein
MAHAFSFIIYAACSQQTKALKNSLEAQTCITRAWRTSKQLHRALLGAHAGFHKEKTLRIWGQTSVASTNGELRGLPTVATQPAFVASRAAFDAMPQVGPKIATMTLQLLYPFDCPLLTLDTWFAQWYGIDPGNKAARLAAEKHWYEFSIAQGWVPAVSREIYWDVRSQKRENEKDFDWWGYPLKHEPITPLLDKLRDIPFPALK